MEFRSCYTKLFKAHFLITKVFILWKLVRYWTITIIELQHLQADLCGGSRGYLSLLVQKLLLNLWMILSREILLSKNHSLFKRDAWEKKQKQKHSLVCQIMISSILPLSIFMWLVLPILLFLSFIFLELHHYKLCTVSPVLPVAHLWFIHRMPMRSKRVMAYYFFCLLRYSHFFFIDHEMLAEYLLMPLLHHLKCSSLNLWNCLYYFTS